MIVPDSALLAREALRGCVPAADGGTPKLESRLPSPLGGKGRGWGVWGRDHAGEVTKGMQEDFVSLACPPAHLWLVDPMDRTLETFDLHDGRWGC